MGSLACKHAVGRQSSFNLEEFSKCIDEKIIGNSSGFRLTFSMEKWLCYHRYPGYLSDLKLA